MVIPRPGSRLTRPGRARPVGFELVEDCPASDSSVVLTSGDLILAGRPEERARVVVPPTATAAQAAFQNWGWHKIARARNPVGLPASDVLVTALPADRER